MLNIQENALRDRLVGVWLALRTDCSPPDEYRIELRDDGIANITRRIGSREGFSGIAFDDGTRHWSVADGGIDIDAQSPGGPSRGIIDDYGPREPSSFTERWHLHEVSDGSLRIVVTLFDHTLVYSRG